ncbi:4-hydroxyphenylpyruvate dioxygenase [Flexithrix dorotheae]|uniref:4-hydroxyphenylpyruvate dioxygenase n=1 Tax=Flexithrix dorotheae TaxID=70993 RepID=UPI00037C502D|nr:4-hydroxyphenylpyruvate dioxygenase [Flexithrix dorotheae]
MTTKAPSIEKILPAIEDFLPLLGVDYIEMYVSNAKQAAHYYQSAFGFQPLAYCGLETGIKDRQSYVVCQGNIKLVLTSPLGNNQEIGKHIEEKGDAVKVVGLTVENANKSYNETVLRGAKPYLNLVTENDQNGEVKRAGIHTYGQTVHMFVERKNYNGIFLPGFEKWESNYQPAEIGFKDVDHIVGNVGWGEMNKWVDFYANVLGFYQLISFDDNEISTDYTALMSKVMVNGNKKIKFPINEPAEGKKKSQVEEYLNFNGGAGVQHIAITTDNIIETVTSLRKRGVEFLTVPKTYYDTVYERVGEIDEELAAIRDLGILVDRDEDGYLLQIFTKPLGPRPTLFFEIIQRKGAQSFGKGNFKALFESIEREQELRGTL